MFFYNFQVCLPNSDGTMMMCDTPNINQTKMAATPNHHLAVDIHFLMDGVQELKDFPQTNPTLSRFRYVMDPVFFKFSGSGNIRTFYEDETHLDIKVRSCMNKVKKCCNIVLCVCCDLALVQEGFMQKM